MADEDDTAPEDDSLNVLLGLLDFHSDRATTHASFVVASIFGIYVVLFSFNDYFASDIYGKIVFVLTYLFLVGISLYSFLNFSQYASLADAARMTMKTFYLKNEKVIKDFENQREDKRKKSILFRKFMDLRRSNSWKKWKTKIFFFVWFFSVILPFLWILIKQ